MSVLNKRFSSFKFTFDVNNKNKLLENEEESERFKNSEINKIK